MNAILALQSSGATLATAGGKGANLAALARAGFDAPPGFILTTEAYRAFVVRNEVGSFIASITDSLDQGDPIALEAASARIRARFAAGVMPEMIGEDIETALARLGPGVRVAVRSSATAEDLPGLSFAGQQDTFLNVLGAANVRAAVVQCWSSLWTARAMGYRARNRIDPAGIALAVVVQVMVDAEASGVMFTANPLSGHRGEIVIDATFGLGEALVAGLVTPDHIVVERRTGRILTHKRGTKALAIRPQPGGGTIQTAEPGAAERAALSEADIAALVDMGERAEALFGGPQDLEWARAGGRMQVLQSRPITTLYPLPEPRLADNGGPRVYLSFNAVQGLAAPFSPLGVGVIETILDGVLTAVGVTAVRRTLLPWGGGRLYIDLTALVRDPLLRRVVFTITARAEPAAGSVTLRMQREGRLPEQRVMTPGRIAGRVLMALRFLPSIAHLMRHPETEMTTRLARTEAVVAEARHTAESAGTLAELLIGLRIHFRGLLPALALELVAPVAAGFGLLAVTERWLRGWLKAPGLSTMALTRGVRNTTTDMNLRLWDAARRIRANPEARRSALADFLARYGMRGAGELDIAAPRWRDDPAALNQTLDSYLHLTDPAAAPDAVFARSEREAAALAGELIAKARASHPLLGGLRARMLRAAIDRARLFTAHRETPKQRMIDVIGAFRQAMLRQGEALVAGGLLSRADDVFWLPLAALDTLAAGGTIDLKAVAAEARAAYAAQSAWPRFPRVMLSTGEAFYGSVDVASDNPNVLLGDGVSPGVAEGLARVIADPRTERLEPGEILVCIGTDPGWTPLFLAARGLVTEVGGMITHGSVVAREYGIPAVVGVEAATTRIKTGQRIRIDGTSGRVTLF